MPPLTTIFSFLIGLLACGFTLIVNQRLNRKNAEQDLFIDTLSRNISSVEGRLTAYSKQESYFSRLRQELDADIARLEELGKQYRKNFSPEEQEIYEEFEELLSNWQEYQERVKKDRPLLEDIEEEILGSD